jgi:hypothetical protein
MQLLGSDRRASQLLTWMTKLQQEDYSEREAQWSVVKLKYVAVVGHIVVEGLRSTSGSAEKRSRFKQSQAHGWT